MKTEGNDHSSIAPGLHWSVARPTIPSSNVCKVWRLPIGIPDSRRSRALSILSSNERHRYDSLKRSADKEIYLASHSGLRYLLSSMTGVAPGRIEFDTEKFGKPYLAAGCRTGALSFNLSHTDGMILVAIAAAAPVGIDVERYSPTENWEEILDIVGIEKERECIRLLEFEDRLAATASLWVRKEAILKGVGVGLTLDPNCIELDVVTGSSAVRWLEESPVSEQWWVCDIDVGGSHRAAVASSNRTMNIVCRTFDPTVCPSA